jgi:hypothetical protein
MATMLRDKDLGDRIKNGLAELLSHFGRSIDVFGMYHDVEWNRKRFRAIINMPWGEQIPVSADLRMCDLIGNRPAFMIQKVVFDLFCSAVNEQDIKEEVANESLPPEVLEVFERITHVADTLVIQ